MGHSIRNFLQCKCCCLVAAALVVTVGALVLLACAVIKGTPGLL